MVLAWLSIIIVVNLTCCVTPVDLSHGELIYVNQMCWSGQPPLFVVKFAMQLIMLIVNLFMSIKGVGLASHFHYCQVCYVINYVGSWGNICVSHLWALSISGFGPAGQIHWCKGRYAIMGNGGELCQSSGFGPASQFLWCQVHYAPTVGHGVEWC